MKLVLAAPFPLPSRAAHGIQVHRMAEAFAGCGPETRLTFKAPRPPSDIDDPFAYYDVRPVFALDPIRVGAKTPSVAAFQFAWKVARSADRGTFVFSRCLKTSVLCALRGIPTAFEAHSSMRDSGRITARLLTIAARLPAFRGIVAITGALREEIAGIAPSISVLVEHDAVQARNLASEAWRIGTREAPVRVGYFGHLYPGKGAEMILPLAQRLPELQFEVVGGDAASVEMWRGKAAGLTNIAFRGFISPAEVAARMLECDILIAPYQRKVGLAGGAGGDLARWMSPLKLFEYMATGRPLVASRLAALEEVLIGGENCELAEPDSVDEWEAALRRLTGDPERARAIAARALADVREHHTWDGRARRILDRFAPEAVRG